MPYRGHFPHCVPSSSSTGNYTHSSVTTTDSDTGGVAADSMNESQVTGTIHATHSLTWDAHGSTVQTLVTPPSISGQAAPTSSWATSGGTMTYSGTTKDDSGYGGTGDSYANNHTSER